MNALQPSFSGKFPPKRSHNRLVRPREYLTEGEVLALLKSAQRVGRYGHRDATLILLSYRHGFRVSELISLQWSEVDFALGRLHIRRRKNGVPSAHPLWGQEIRALRKLQRESAESPYVFVTERGGPLTESTAFKIIARAGRFAKLPFPVHPHMLRHATGYKLANDGHDTRSIQEYLGHKNIQHTVRYTELAAGRFQRFWKD